MYLYPNPLHPGDTIAVTAPSSGIPDALIPRFHIAVQHLKDQGFNVILGECLLGNHRFVSAPVSIRVHELMEFLSDDAIDAVIPPYGGELATELLPYIKFDALQQARPKWLIGYSDISTLCCAIASQCNWATVHSSCLMEWLPTQQDPLTRDVLSHLATVPGKSFSQSSSSHFEISGTDWIQQPDAPFKLTQKTRWKSLRADHVMKGRLFGGCLDILMLQLDSPYIDIANIKSRHGEDGTVLYLENAELSPTALKRALLVLLHKGILHHLNGLLIGRHAGVDDDTHGLTYEQVIKDCLTDLDCPVFYDVDIGHVPPNLTLVNGALVTIEKSADQAMVTQQLV